MATLEQADRDVVRAAIDRYGPPAMRGDAAPSSRGAANQAGAAASRVASPRIARELVKELVVEQPVKRRCGYCGHKTKKRTGACHAHGDLPELERVLFRDFCAALTAEAA